MSPSEPRHCLGCSWLRCGSKRYVMVAQVYCTPCSPLTNHGIVFSAQASWRWWSSRCGIVWLLQFSNIQGSGKSGFKSCMSNKHATLRKRSLDSTDNLPRFRTQINRCWVIDYSTSFPLSIPVSISSLLIVTMSPFLAVGSTCLGTRQEPTWQPWCFPQIGQNLVLSQTSKVLPGRNSSRFYHFFFCLISSSVSLAWTSCILEY